jgi:hypothetical protein
MMSHEAICGLFDLLPRCYPGSIEACIRNKRFSAERSFILEPSNLPITDNPNDLIELLFLQGLGYVH